MKNKKNWTELLHILCFWLCSPLVGNNFGIVQQISVLLPPFKSIFRKGFIVMLFQNYSEFHHDFFKVLPGCLWKFSRNVELPFKILPGDSHQTFSAIQKLEISEFFFKGSLVSLRAMSSYIGHVRPIWWLGTDWLYFGLWNFILVLTRFLLEWSMPQRENEHNNEKWFREGYLRQMRLATKWWNLSRTHFRCVRIIETIDPDVHLRLTHKQFNIVRINCLITIWFRLSGLFIKYCC